MHASLSITYGFRNLEVYGDIGLLSKVKEFPEGPPNPPPLEVIYQFGYRVVALDELKSYEMKSGVKIPYLKELIDGPKLMGVIVEVPQGRLVRVIFEYTLRSLGSSSTSLYIMV